MFQAFLVLCTVGLEPSYDNCVVQVQPAMLFEEWECIDSLNFYIDNLSQTGLFDVYEIHNVGCHSYILSDKKVEL